MSPFAAKFRAEGRVQLIMTRPSDSKAPNFDPEGTETQSEDTERCRSSVTSGSSSVKLCLKMLFCYLHFLFPTVGILPQKNAESTENRHFRILALFVFFRGYSLKTAPARKGLADGVRENSPIWLRLRRAEISETQNDWSCSERVATARFAGSA